MTQLPAIPPDVPAVILDENDRLDSDLPCVHCGYNLRGLLLEQACPECGTAIGRSVEGDLLCFADPDWVMLLSRGTKLILISIVVFLGSIALIPFAAGFGTSMQQIGNLIVQGVGGLLNLAGYWLFTSPEPSQNEQEVGLNARLVGRWGEVGSFALGIIGSAIAIADPLLGTAAAGVGSLLGVGAMIGIGLWAIKLARRVPDLTLAKNTKIVMWGFGICIAVMAVVGVFAATIGGAAGAGGAGPAPVAGGIFMISACTFGVGLFVFSIWSLVLLIQYNNRLRTAAAQARATWAADLPNAGTDTGGASGTDGAVS